MRAKYIRVYNIFYLTALALENNPIKYMTFILYLLSSVVLERKHKTNMVQTCPNQPHLEKKEEN
jgi:hypothetical protein